MATAMFTDQTSDGVSSSVSYSGETTFNLSGVFHGALVHIEISDDGGTTWHPRIQFAHPQTFKLNLTGTWHFRGRVQNAGSSTSITLKYDND